MEDFETIKKEYSGLSDNELIEIIVKLKGELNYLQSLFFASKKERSKPDPEGMPLLFDEVEQTVSESSEADEEYIETKGYKRKRGKRKPLPDNLPRVRQEIDLPESEKFCKLHGRSLEKIGEEIIEKLEIVPAKSHVLQQVISKYKCPCCESQIIEPLRDPDPIPKSFATPSLLAYLLVSKYVDGLPLHRQEKILQRHGIELPRTTMARWMIAMGELFAPLVNFMHEDLLASPVIHADETTLQVLCEPNRPAEAKSYMWALARQGDQPIIIFRYYDNRSKAAARDLLLGFEGTLVCDGYKVYSSLALNQNIVLAGCLAHVRRKFWHAEKIAKNDAKNSVSIRASEALKFIRQIYHIEKKIKDSPPEEIYKLRQKKSLPIIQEFHVWLLAMETIILPSSPTGKAIRYALDQWDKILAFTNNGLVPVDNNYLESHLRPFVIGRNNWMFAATPKGAHASAAIYSLVETAKANGVDPFDYLKLIVKELPKAQFSDDYEKLLPYRARDHFTLNAYR